MRSTTRVSHTEVQNHQIGSKISLQGKDATIVRTSAAYITVVDNNGNEISVPKDSSLFDYSQRIVDSNNKRIEKLKDKAEEYQTLKAIAQKNKKSFLAQMSSRCKEWGVKFWHQMDGAQRKEYKGLKDSYYAAVFDATAAGNREFSALTDAFCLTLDNAKYLC